MNGVVENCDFQLLAHLSDSICHKFNLSECEELILNCVGKARLDGRLGGEVEHWNLQHAGNKPPPTKKGSREGH